MEEPKTTHETSDQVTDQFEAVAPETEQSAAVSESAFGRFLKHELVLIILFALTIGGISLTAQVVNQQSQPVAEDPQPTQPSVVVTSFAECAAHYPVMESYPEQCRTPEGELFVRDIGNELEMVDLIRLSTPRPGASVTSPLRLAGEARGYWFFEATAPVVLTNWDGLIIAEGYISAEGEWMTEEFVPFSGELTFVADTGVSDRGSLILHKANASGLPEHDAALEIPVTFAEEEVVSAVDPEAMAEAAFWADPMSAAVDSDAIQEVIVASVVWQDSCMGAGGPAESCLRYEEEETGFEVTIIAESSEGEPVTAIYRVNQEGTELKRVP